MANPPRPSALGEHQEKTSTREDVESNNTQKASWKHLFAFTAKQHIPTLLCALVCGTIVGLVFPGLAILYGLIFQQFAKFGSGQITGTELLHNASRYCLYVTAVTAGGWLASSLCFMAQVAFGELQARAAREEVFDALLEKDSEWYDNRDNGTAALLSAVQL